MDEPSRTPATGDDFKQNASGTHPILDDAQRLLEREVGQVVLSPAAVCTIENELAELFQKPDLRLAVLSLASLAMYLSEHGGIAASLELLRICTTATAALKAQTASSTVGTQKLNEVTTRAFLSFTATDKINRAPAKITSKYGNGNQRSNGLSIGAIQTRKPRPAR